MASYKKSEIDANRRSLERLSRASCCRPTIWAPSERILLWGGLLGWWWFGGGQWSRCLRRVECTVLAPCQESWAIGMMQREGYWLWAPRCRPATFLACRWAPLRSGMESRFQSVLDLACREQTTVVVAIYIGGGSSSSSSRISVICGGSYAHDINGNISRRNTSLYNIKEIIAVIVRESKEWRKTKEMFGLSKRRPDKIHKR